MQNRGLRSFAILFLAAEAIGAAGWWAMLLIKPASRAPFLAPGAPDSTLFAFLLPDAALFIGAAGVAAWGLSRNRAWVGVPLWLHAGAAGYSALCAIGIVLWSGGGLLGAVMMLPSLLVAPYLAWRLAPQ